MSIRVIIMMYVLLYASRAFGLGADYPHDRPVKLDKAPPGLSELINQTNRVHGYFVNAEDRFFFIGDNRSFNAFLKQYAKLEAIAGHRLIIHQGKGRAKSPWSKDDGQPCEWMLEVAKISWREGHNSKVFYDSPQSRKRKPIYLVEVHVWSGGKINMAEIKIPKIISVANEMKEQKGERGESNYRSIRQKTTFVGISPTLLGSALVPR